MNDFHDLPSQEEPHNPLLLEALRHAKRHGYAQEHNVERGVEMLLARITTKSGQAAIPRLSVRGILRGEWMKYAAAAVVMAVIGIKYIPDIVEHRRPATTHTYTTAPGQRATVTLADGSTVMLAPATTMQVTRRIVELNGEAVFTVNNHKKEPFTVQTNNTVVRVLGTTFGVRAYPTDKTVRVAVAEGKVGLANGPVLTMGELADVAVNGRAIVRRNVDVIATLSWTQGRLYFASVPFKDVITDLERWYGLTVTVADSELSEALVTARFDNPPVSDVLNALAGTLNARYERTGMQVKFFVK